MLLPTAKTPPKPNLADLAVLVYGPTKIGKSTWCSDAEGALFPSTEPGLNSLEVFQVPVRSWDELLAACGELAEGNHPYKKVIIDTLNNAYCESNPARSITMKRLSRTPPEYLTETEKKRLLKELHDRTNPLARRDRVIFELFLSTGIRLSELVNLDLDDVDLDGKHIRVMGKGGVPQVKFQKSSVRTLLRAYLKERRHLASPEVSGALCILTRCTALQQAGRSATVLLACEGRRRQEDHAAWTPAHLRHASLLPHLRPAPREACLCPQPAVPPSPFLSPSSAGS